MAGLTQRLIPFHSKVDLSVRASTSSPRIHVIACEAKLGREHGQAPAATLNIYVISQRVSRLVFEKSGSVLQATMDALAASSKVDSEECADDPASLFQLPKPSAEDAAAAKAAVAASAHLDALGRTVGKVWGDSL